MSQTVTHALHETARRQASSGARRSARPGSGRTLAGWVWLFSRLVKARYHVTFVNVVFGALIFAAPLDAGLTPRLLALYLSFNVLFYGGIYTMNDLADRDSDACHPQKCLRPIPAGEIGLRAASLFALVSVAGGLVSGFSLFGSATGVCYLAVLAINVLYSTIGRNLAYLDLLLNGVPHAVRFYMGVLLVGRQPPVGHVIAVLALAVGLSCLRRHVEHDVSGWEARRTLRHYTQARLAVLASASLAVVALLCLVDGGASPGFYLVLFSTAAVLVGGGLFCEPVRSPLRAVWTR